MALKLARPPKDLNSFIGRKWLESLSVQSEDLTSFAAAAFVLLASQSGLTNARTLADSSDIGITDNGAGSTITFSLLPNGVVAGTYNNITVDQDGRVTSGSNVSYAELSDANIFTAQQTVPADPYDSGWGTSLEVPTKKDVYDKIQTLPTDSIDDDARRLVFLGF